MGSVNEEMDAVVSDLRGRLQSARSSVGSTWTLPGLDGGKDATLYGLAQAENRIGVLDTASRDKVNAGVISYATWLSYAEEIGRTIASHTGDVLSWDWKSVGFDFIGEAAQDLRDGIKKAADIAPWVSTAVVALVALYFAVNLGVFRKAA